MAIPKLALIPASQGTSLYSVLPSNGVGDFAFTRAGSATRINSQGLIETVASGVSRLNYPLIDGVVNGCPSHLLEPQRSNLLPYSEDFSDAGWTKTDSNITENTTTSPNGTLTADSLIENTSTSVHRAFKTLAVTGTHTYSFYVKANGRQWIAIGAGNTSSFGALAYFDIENGVLGTVSVGSANIENAGNGWYRCSVTGVGNGGGTSFNIWLANANNSISYLGDGTSGIYIWGAQLEAGSYPTSYIPTNGSAVTRSAETANGAGDASTFNDSEGVLFAEISALDNSTVERIAISDGSNDNRVYFTKTGIANELRFAIVDGSISQASITKVVNDNTSMHKIAGKYKANDVAFWINGFEVGTDTNATMPSGLDELAFDSGSGSLDFYGNTKQIQYYDSALTDSELETLTSWVSFTDMANGQQFTIE